MLCVITDALKCAVCTNYCVEQPAVSVQELAELSLVDRALARAQQTRKIYKNKVSRSHQHSLFLQGQFTCPKGHLSEGSFVCLKGHLFEGSFVCLKGHLSEGSFVCLKGHLFEGSFV